MTVPRPTIGRIVQYLAPMPGRPSAAVTLAAIITGVFEAGDGADMCTLTVFEPGKPPRPLAEAVRQGETENTWRYPPIQPVAK